MESNLDEAAYLASCVSLLEGYFIPDCHGRTARISSSSKHLASSAVGKKLSQRRGSKQSPTKSSPKSGAKRSPLDDIVAVLSQFTAVPSTSLVIEQVRSSVVATLQLLGQP